MPPLRRVRRWYRTPERAGGRPPVSAEPLRTGDAYAIAASTVRRYYRALDGGDRDAWLDIFEPDGQLVLTNRDPIVGTAGLERFWAGRPRGVVHRKHVVTDLDVVAFDDREIRATNEIQTLDLVTGSIVAIGSSADHLRRGVEGGWRYTVKQIRLTYRSPAL